jgi:hypothetical protein
MFSLLARCHGEWASHTEHARADRRGDLLVHRELLALIPGERPSQRLRQIVQRARDRLAHDPIGERQQDQDTENRAHDLGLGIMDLHMRGAPRLRSDAPEAVGDLPREHVAGAGAVQLAAPVALGDLRRFVRVGGEVGGATPRIQRPPGIRARSRRSGSCATPSPYSAITPWIWTSNLAAGHRRARGRRRSAPARRSARALRGSAPGRRRRARAGPGTGRAPRLARRPRQRRAGNPALAGPTARRSNLTPHVE